MAAAALRRAMTAFTRSPDPTDADLIRQFADGRSEEAFAALVRRHGPLVLGVCRRVVPDRHLADDAFQAAFVVLARRAGGIDPARPLGPWLYGVAHRVALRARTMLGKRRRRETLTASVPDTPRPAPAVDDVCVVLDEEIAKLPPAARDAVILCELQGLSRREAANKLGIAEGTLSSRLAAARKTLAAKLQSRGVVLSVVLTSAVLSPELATAAVAAGTGVSLSSVVVSLADGASAMTLLNKLKLTGVAVLFLLLTAGGVGPWQANEMTAAPVPKVKDHGLIWLHDRTKNTLIALSPDGREVERWQLPADHTFLGVTPDGTSILYAANGTYHLRPFDEATGGTGLGVRYEVGDRIDGWHPHGTRFLKSRHEEPGKMVGVRFPVVEYVVVDVVARTVTPLTAPANTYVLGWMPDGKQFIGNAIPFGKDEPRGLCVFASGEKSTPLTLDDHATPLTFAPSTDGKTQLVGGWKSRPGETPYHAAYRFAPAAGTITELLHEDGQNMTQVAASPDSTRMAVLWGFAPKPSNTWDELRLTVAHADGTNRSTVTLRDKGKGRDPQSLTLLGWFPNKVNAPVPQLKAKLPEKLDRVPTAPAELRKELAGWDEKYRHGNEEKFAELEKRAEEVAKGCESDHDRARVWYTVAHVAGQSDIRKHAYRVRKYAEKCLKISRDPLDRGRLYSYLASCEEVGKGEFADRRRKAADWLLKGYLELLAQELPDVKPELPGVMKFRIPDDGPDAAQTRAKHAAQMAAREKAEWACDQIGRRDTLVLQFRNLYEPNSKVHGHGPDGPDELRKLAAAKLPTADDVDTLMERVLPTPK